jgi:hypothetical protein
VSGMSDEKMIVGVVVGEIGRKWDKIAFSG